MASADGSILIRTKVDTNGIKHGTNAIQSSVGKINNSLLKLGSTIAAVFSVYKLIQFGKEAVNAASQMTNAMIGLKSIVEGTGNSFAQATNFIESYISDGLVPATNAVTAYKNLLMRGYTTEQIEKVMTALKDSAAFGRQASLSLGDAVQSATEGLKNENSILVDNAGVTKNVSKMWEDYAASIGKTANNLTQQEKIQAEVNGILTETRFQTGDAAKVADTWSGKIAVLTFNWNKFLVLVGGRLIQVLTPAINVINSLLVAAINLGNAMANVFGWQVQQSSAAGTTAGYVSDTADSESDLADSTAETNKALKKQLAFFDDINVLSSESASGASGGTSTGGGTTGGGGGVVNTDKTVQQLTDLEKQMMAFLERIKEAWKTDADFTFLGEEFAKAINTMLADIDWDAIKTNAYKLGKSISTFLNGSIKETDWNLVGTTLAESLNTAIKFSQGLIENFDFKKFGEAIGKGINGFFKTTDFEQLFDNASDLTIGLLDAISSALDETDFVLIGEKIADGLEAVDWNTIFESLGTLISEAIGGSIDILSGIKKTAEESEVGKSELEKLFPDTVWEWLQIGFATIGLDIEVVVNNKQKIDDLNEAIKNADISAQGATQSTVDLQSAVDGVNPWVKIGVKYDENGWNTTLSKLVADISVWWNDTVVVWWDTNIVSFWDEKVRPWFTIKKWQELGQGMIDGISTKWDEFLVWWDKTGIPSWFEEYVMPWFTVEKWQGIGQNMQDGMKAGFKGIVGWIVGVLNGIIDSFESMVNFVVDGANVLIDKFNSLPSAVRLGYTASRFGKVEFGNIKVPALAQGAVLPPNKPFLSVVGDQKSGTNIEAPLDTIKQALAEVMASSGNSGNNTINLNIDGQTFARLFMPSLLNEMGRQGLDIEALGVS